jgi:NAD(P)-dependent dehydrogenase (short-subunit alcohol dehydrogenase family)
MMGKKYEFPEELDFIRTGRLPQKVSSESMDGKICVITGATTGIGYQAAVRLAKAGAKIVMIVRNRDKAEKLCAELEAFSSCKHDYYLADFESLSEVRKAVESVLANYPKIDVLINNAGIHLTTRQLTKEGNEKVFAVNHLASFMVTVLLLKRMVESAPSRIIFVNSEGHRFNGLQVDDLDWAKRKYGGYGSYGASKTAQLMTLWELNDLLQGKGVTINAMHPGAVKSNIGNYNGWFYNWFSKYIMQPMLKDPVISGDALYFLASSKEMDGISGKFFNLTNEEIPAKHARDRAIGRKIFEISKTLTHLADEKYYTI